MSSGTLKSAHDLLRFFRKLTEHIAAFASLFAVQMAKESEICPKKKSLSNFLRFHSQSSHAVACPANFHSGNNTNNTIYIE